MMRFQEAAVWSSGKFRIDEKGRVWRGTRRAENRTGEYLQVKVTVGGIRRYTCAHRLVWHALRGPIPPGMVINHLNGIKDDNRPENLECTSPGENSSHAHRVRLRDQRGQRNPAAKLKDCDVVKIRLAYAAGGYTQQDLAQKFRVDHRTISKIVRGERRSIQGGPTADYTLRRKQDQLRDPKTGTFLGKKAAGSLLDGREWKQFPGVR